MKRAGIGRAQPVIVVDTNVLLAAADRDDQAIT
jgi:hypothetical protein